MNAAASMLAYLSTQTAGGDEPGGGDYVPTTIAPYVATNGIHFIASKAKSATTVFCGDSACPVDNFPVYINGELTDQKINGLTFAAGDEVLIGYTHNSDYEHFPAWAKSSAVNIGFNLPSAGIDFVKTWLEPLPLLKNSSGKISFHESPGNGIQFYNSECFINGTLPDGVTKNTVPKNFFGNLMGIEEQLWMINCNISGNGSDFFSGLNGKYFPNFSNSNRYFSSVPAGIFAELTDSYDAYTLFSMCTRLSKVPDDIFENCGNLKSIYLAFEHCTSLKSVSEIFKNCPLITNAAAAFEYCKSLASIPVDLFANCPNITTFNSVFLGCSALEPVVRITAPNVTNVGNFAKKCKSPAVVYVPAGSTTATTFKNAPSTANIGQVIEE